MKRLSVFFMASLLLFSSCLFHGKSENDLKADSALGVSGSQQAPADAQDELDRLKKVQFDEQKRQLDRQITDPNQNTRNG